MTIAQLKRKRRKLAKRLLHALDDADVIDLASDAAELAAIVLAFDEQKRKANGKQQRANRQAKRSR